MTDLSAATPDGALSRGRAARLDTADPLERFRDGFVPVEPGLIYLDGNSLGRLPRATVDRLHEVVTEEWGQGLIRSWAHWIDLSRAVGDEIAVGVLDARPGEVVVSDSTTVNLYKLASAALDAHPDRRVIVVEADNFPTDLYVFQGLAEARGLELRVVPSDLDRGPSIERLRAALDGDVALVSLSHVGYRSGALVDMAAVNDLAREAGAWTLWDLSHAAGSVPVPLAATGADLAVGCTYKYLNGGPGAPAFLYVRNDLQARLRQPIWGWFGQTDQFAMDAGYQPRPGIERFTVGTPNVLGLYAVREGVRMVAEAGVDRLRAKGIALGTYAVELADAWLAPLGFTLASPRGPDQRGGHVTLRHPDAWRICQASIARKVVPDYRSPDRVRLGLAALSTSFGDVWEALDRLRRLVEAGEQTAFPTEPGRVT